MFTLSNQFILLELVNNINLFVKSFAKPSFTSQVKILYANQFSPPFFIYFLFCREILLLLVPKQTNRDRFRLFLIFLIDLSWKFSFSLLMFTCVFSCHVDHDVRHGWWVVATIGASKSCMLLPSRSGANQSLTDTWYYLTIGHFQILHIDKKKKCDGFVWTGNEESPTLVSA